MTPAQLATEIRRSVEILSAGNPSPQLLAAVHELAAMATPEVQAPEGGPALTEAAQQALEALEGAAGYMSYKTATGKEVAAAIAAMRAALAAQPRPDADADVRELSKWLNEEPNRPLDRAALARVLAAQPVEVELLKTQLAEMSSLAADLEAKLRAALAAQPQSTHPADASKSSQGIDASPAEAHEDGRAAFEAAFLSANGFHTKAELAAEWEKGLSGVMFRAGLAAHPQPKGTEPASWREHIEDRLRTWKQRTMNESGDMLALDDFMDSESLEDLIDFVCDEWAEPAAPSPAPVAGLCERICAAIKAADDKSVDEAGYMLDSNDCIKIVRDHFEAAGADPLPIVDMVPPATSRDRWMYEQGRLAESDPRTTQSPAVAHDHAAAMRLAVGALEKLLARDQSNTCTHQNTHRGGAIWEICDDCGAKWSDDRNPKPKWKEPAEWKAAEAAVDALGAALGVSHPPVQGSQP